MLRNQKISKRFPLTVDGFDVRQPPFPMLDIKDAKIKNCQLQNRKLKQIYFFCFENYQCFLTFLSQINFFKRMDLSSIPVVLAESEVVRYGWPHIFTGNPGLSLDPRVKKCRDHKT